MISIEGLYFRYKRNTIYENLKWDVTDGTTAGLLGKNGAGKSTLLRLVSGILSEDKGTVKVDGHRPFDRKKTFLQDIFLLPEDMATDNIRAVEYAYRYGSFYPRFDLDSFLALCDTLEVDSCKSLAKMSYGQKKKAMIAFALSLGVKHLLLDEPSNGLDISSKITLRRLIKEYSTAENIIIISTHEVQDIENIADTLSILEKGQVIFNGNINCGHSYNNPYTGTGIEDIFCKFTKPSSDI